MNSKELQERLTEYAVGIIDLTAFLVKNAAGNHLGNQLLKSGTSPALNYAEAIGAESKKDFIHKNRIVLKELRECEVCLNIIGRANLISPSRRFLLLKEETNELVSIFVSALKTMQLNSPKR